MQVQDTPAIALDDLRTIDELVAAHPTLLTQNAIRWHLRFRDENGLAPAVVKFGKKILISQSRFEQWIATRCGAVQPSTSLKRAA